MTSGDKTLFARIGIGLVAIFTMAAAGWVFDSNMRSADLKNAIQLDLRGEWKFHNGALEPTADISSFKEAVNVPLPLLPQLKERLKDEYWYQRSFTIPSQVKGSGEHLSLFLGSIKGDHEIYWNGVLVNKGERTSLSLTPLSATITKAQNTDLRVRIKKLPHLFPGIVHVQPVAIGLTSKLESFREFYVFDSGVKSLLLGCFKLSLFLLFALLFTMNPKRSEYLSFSLFALCSALASVSFSRFMPFYYDFYFRNGVTFLCSVGSFALLPWLCSDVLRMKSAHRKYALGFGVTLALIVISSTFWIASRDLEITLYQLVGKWLPVLVGIPSLVACGVCLKQMDSTLTHRKLQISAFAFFLTLGTIGWFLSAGALLSFSYIPYPELWDIGLFAGLALSASMDAHFSSKRSERAGKVIPKWFSGFLASGNDQVTLELPMVAIAVDTVGYTRLLSEMDSEGKAELHNNIRARMAPVVEQFGAQKLSDRGDGALFAWDLSGNEETKRSTIRQALAGAEYLVIESSNSVGIKFRVGMAVGLVRGELKGSELSFLGEPLNAASRLEAAAKPGTVLIHDTVAPYLDPSALTSEWIKIEVKGVSYRAFTLTKAS